LARVPGNGRIFDRTSNVERVEAMKKTAWNFDVHVHMDIGTDVEQVVENARKLKCRLGISSLGSTFHMPDNESVAEAIRRYPDVVVGFGYIALGRGDGPSKVEKLHRQGFRALKMICPKKDYDDKSYYPIYAKAEDLHMPVLFHTGVVARMDVWAKKHGWKDMEAIDFRSLDISSNRMRPICLDAIARAFPDLNLIMAHFCSLGRRDEAAAVLKHNPNVYADLTTLSGAKTKAQVRENAKLVKSFLSTHDYGKLLFGTDLFTSSDTGRLKLGIKAINMLLDELKVTREVRVKIMGETAEELVGMKR